MADITDISKEELQKEIEKILSTANLATTSAKNVRQQLEKTLGVDLNDKRQLINQLVMDYVNSKESEEEEEEEEEASSEEETVKKKPVKAVTKHNESSEDEDYDEFNDSECSELCCVMPNFTNWEYADMMMAYGEAARDSRKALSIYLERYPARRVPHHEVFTRTYHRLREAGNVYFD